jgi:hypothetical protein
VLQHAAGVVHQFDGLQLKTLWKRTTMKPHTLAVAAGVTIAIAVFYFDRRQSRQELDRMQEVVARLEQDKARVAALPVPVVRMQEVRTEPSAPPAAEPTRAGVAEPSSPPATRPRASPAVLSPLEAFSPIHDTMEALFASEPTDASWAREARRTAEGAVTSQLPPGSRLTAVDCRSTLCRIESNHETGEEAQRFVGALTEAGKRPWNGTLTAGPVEHDARTGRTVYVTYLLREGVDLPASDEPLR